MHVRATLVELAPYTGDAAGESVAPPDTAAAFVLVASRARSEANAPNDAVV